MARNPFLSANKVSTFYSAICDCMVFTVYWLLFIAAALLSVTTNKSYNAKYYNIMQMIAMT